MSLRLLLLRHGETDWNQERRFQGWMDTTLSPTGRAQAEAAARMLAAQPLAAVWASPLARALDTARAIAAPHGLPVETDPAFKEMRFGPWEGLTVGEVQARWPEEYRTWVERPHELRLGGAETVEEVRRRVLDGLDGLRGRHQGQTVCLVAHGVSSRILILEALGLPLERAWAVQVSSTGLSELEFRDDWTALHRMNTLVHLNDLTAGRGGPA
ncbi:MAG TPA: histidine phosphatase family protein [Methylomirabilota bacterium]|nr:histidine phosphatase family protein [Methylomirabilota bacterium]